MGSLQTQLKKLEIIAENTRQEATLLQQQNVCISVEGLLHSSVWQSGRWQIAVCPWRGGFLCSHTVEIVSLTVTQYRDHAPLPKRLVHHASLMQWEEFSEDDKQVNFS